jgi:hypothetical protein
MQILSRLTIFVLMLGSSFTSPAQVRYRAGFASSSLEPASYPFSLSLAGYGAPRDGRFTLEWIKKNGTADGLVFGSTAAYKGWVYVLTAANDLMKYEQGKENTNGIKIARYNGISYDVKLKGIAVANNTLYGIDSANIIYTGRHRTDGDLAVSALAIASGKQRVVLVGADVCGFDAGFINSIKQEIYRKHKIPPAAILVNASHTHFAPVTQNWLTWGEHNQKPDSAYMYGIVKPAIISAIQTALRRMEPSTIYFGRGKTTIGGNRTFRNAPLPYDDDVDVIDIVRTKGKERTVLFLAGCHPVFKNEGAEGITISANYPGVTRRWLDEKAGINQSMFIQGCGGDINPVDASHVNTGNKLAADITAVLNKPQEALNGKISFYLDSINFPVKKWTEAALMEFRNRNSGKEGDVYAEKNVRWADMMLQSYRANTIPASMPVYIQTINIGQWKLVGLSREAVTDYSMGIKKLWPGALVSVAGYCNDVSSYLPTQRHIREGVYEGMDSFFWYGQPAVFPESVYDDILEKIKQQNH